MSDTDFFSVTACQTVRFAMVGNKVIRLDEIQSVVPNFDSTKENPQSLVRFRNKEGVIVDATPGDVFDLIGTEASV